MLLWKLDENVFFYGLNFIKVYLYQVFQAMKIPNKCTTFFMIQNRRSALIPERK